MAEGDDKKNEKEPKKSNLFGYHLEGVLALGGLVVSILTVLISIVTALIVAVTALVSVATFALSTYGDFYAPAEPDLLPPGQVTINCIEEENKEGKDVCEKKTDKQQLYIKAVPLTLVNKTPFSRSFTAISSEVIMRAYSENGTQVFLKSSSKSKKEITLKWQYIGEGEERKSVGAITVAPRESESVEVHYYPRTDRTLTNEQENFLHFSDFNKAIFEESIYEIEFTFIVDLLDAEPEAQLEKYCSVYVDKKFIKKARDIIKDNVKNITNNYTYYSRDCIEKDAPHPTSMMGNADHEGNGRLGSTSLHSLWTPYP